MADKSGLGSLILSISIIAAVALVTFQATQEQGAGEVSVPVWNPAAQKAVPGEQPSATPTSVPAEPQTWGIGQITGALLVYLSGQDGQITDAEIQKIASDVAVTWKVQADDSVKAAADMVRGGQGEALVRKALEDLSKSSYEVKVQTMAWVADWLRTQGWSWENIQKATGRWTQDVLKLDSVDFWGALRKE